MPEQKVTVTLRRVNKGEGYSVSADRWRPIVHQKSDDFLSWDWVSSGGLNIIGAKIHFFATESRFVGTGQNLGGKNAKAKKTGKVKKDPKFRKQTKQYEMTIRFKDGKGPVRKIRVDPEYRVEF